jgi:anti-sigma factor RsiW
MNCADVQKNLSAYFDGEMPFEPRSPVAKHLSKCADCSAQLEKFRSLSAMAKRLPDTAAPELWDSIERQLAKSDSPAASLVSVAIDSRRRMQRRVMAIAAMAAALLIGVFIGYPLVKWHGRQAEVAMNLTGYVEVFRKDPSEAQRSLLAKYTSHPVKPEEVVALVNYKPAAPETLPDGLTRAAMYEIDMPCCKCIESLYQRADGRMVAVFEHADKQPAAIGDRPSINTQCHGKEVGLVNCDGQLCASWKEEGRFVTVVGAAELAEVEQIVAAIGKPMSM